MDFLGIYCYYLCMKRDILYDLFSWSTSPHKKPLVLKGARQVGKTWALLEFGKRHYEEKGYLCHYIDFRSAKELFSIFEETSNPAEIVKLLQFRLKIEINVQHDLLIFDEIQECPQAIISFKYFAQNMRELDIIAAGSHLGLMKNQESFPVGKVDFLYMFPLTFQEFLQAVDSDAFGILEEWEVNSALPGVVHDRLIDLWTVYLFTGGLPEVVQTWVDESANIMRAISKVRTVQRNLIEGYRSDFSKYSGVVNAAYINYTFDAVSSQLSKVQDENVKKFMFKAVIPNRKGFDSIRGPLFWLRESRLIIKTGIAGKAFHPLRSYTDENRFKIFLFDTGILNCLLDIPGEVILDKEIGPYKGFLIENYIAQELYAYYNRDLLSWQEGTSELEFTMVNGKEIIPLEVKSASRQRRAKSLDAFISRYAPRRALKLTGQNYGYSPDRGITTVPLYACTQLLQKL